MNRNRFFLAVILVVLGVLGVMGQETNTRSCKAPKDRIKYKVIDESQSKRTGTLHVWIIVKRKNFTKSRMVRLARSLRARYCKEKDVLFVLFDSIKDAERISVEREGWDPYKVVRGYYSFDEKRQLDGLEFSLEKGNDTKEVVIDLSDYWFQDKKDNPQYFETSKLALKPHRGKFPTYALLPFYIERRDHGESGFYLLSGWLLDKENCSRSSAAEVQREWVKRHPISEVIEIYRFEEKDKEKKSSREINSSAVLCLFIVLSK